MKRPEDNESDKSTNMHDNADSHIGLANSIRKRRRALKLTQEDLSDMSGVSLRLIHELEHGKETVRLGNLVKILSSVGLHLELTLGASDHIKIDSALNQLTRTTR